MKRGEYNKMEEGFYRFFPLTLLLISSIVSDVIYPTVNLENIYSYNSERSFLIVHIVITILLITLYFLKFALATVIKAKKEIVDKTLIKLEMLRIVVFFATVICMIAIFNVFFTVLLSVILIDAFKFNISIESIYCIIQFVFAFFVWPIFLYKNFAIEAETLFSFEWEEK